MPLHLFSCLALLAVCGSFLVFSGCASLSGLQDGRTVGQGKGEFSLGLNLTQTPDFDSEIETDIPSFFIPLVELGARYGFTEKFDAGLRVNSGLNFLVDGKYQFVGDQDSDWAVSAGAGVGTFGVAGPVALFNFQLPMYASYHPAENFSVYLSPRYIGQFGTSFARAPGLLNYLGTNLGILSGTRTQFGLDVGIYRVSNRRTGISDVLFQIGGGVKFSLGTR